MIPISLHIRKKNAISFCRLMSKLIKNDRFDTVIIGGGPIGSSIAYHLAMICPDHKIAVIEKDSSYSKASCMLSAGGIRQQFSVPENIKMSMYSAEFLKNIKHLEVDGEVPDIQFHENGYLYLSSERGEKILRENNKVQVDCGASWIKLYNESQLKPMFPWLNTDGISLGSFSTSNEGYFDPWSYVNALKKKSISMGVTYIEGTVFGASINSTSSASGLTKRNISGIQIAKTNNCKSLQSQEVITLTAGNFVNAAGAWAGKLVDIFAKEAQKSNSSSPIHELPVKPRKRCIFTVHCPNIQSPSNTYTCPPSSTPLVIDPSGVYFRPEGARGRFIAGVSPPEDMDADCEDKDLDTVDHDLFNESIWPVLSERVPAFECLKVQSSWAGFYEYNTLDQNAIIGHHTDFSNLILCNGFSGHGLQQSPAAGRAVSELIAYCNKFQTLDLSRFSFERIVDNKPIHETGIV